jgi:hypothetical protein
MGTKQSKVDYISKLDYGALVTMLTNLNYYYVLKFFSVNKYYYEMRTNSTFYKFSVINIIHINMMEDLNKKISIGSSVYHRKFSIIYKDKYQHISKIPFLLGDIDFFILIKIALSALDDFKSEFNNKLSKFNIANEESKWLRYISNEIQEDILQFLYNETPNIDTIVKQYPGHYDNRKIIGIIPINSNGQHILWSNNNNEKLYRIISEPI